MRYYFNGSGFTVGFNHQDSRDFSESWPCSSVEGKGSFSFAAGGDLVDAEGAAATGDGSDWQAFSEDCKTYGELKFKRDAGKEALGGRLQHAKV
jgi:hypothetical protein